MRKLVLVLALVALAPYAFAACGGDDEESADTATTTEETTEAGGGGGEEAGGGGGAVAVSAVPDGSLAFEQDELSAPAGSATFEFTNPASLDHDFCIEEAGSEVGCADIVSDGD